MSGASGYSRFTTSPGSAAARAASCASSSGLPVRGFGRRAGSGSASKSRASARSVQPSGSPSRCSHCCQFLASASAAASGIALRDLGADPAAHDEAAGIDLARVQPRCAEDIAMRVQQQQVEAPVDRLEQRARRALQRQLCQRQVLRPAEARPVAALQRLAQRGDEVLGLDIDDDGRRAGTQRRWPAQAGVVLGLRSATAAIGFTRCCRRPACRTPRRRSC